QQDDTVEPVGICGDRSSHLPQLQGVVARLRPVRVRRQLRTGDRTGTATAEQRDRIPLILSCDVNVERCVEVRLTGGLVEVVGGRGAKALGMREGAGVCT